MDSSKKRGAEKCLFFTGEKVFQIPKEKKEKSILDIQIGGGTNEDISVFTRQMSTLIQGGTAITQKFGGNDQATGEKPKFKAMLESVAEKVSSGSDISDGLAMYPKTFDKLYVNMVKAGRSRWCARPCPYSTCPISGKINPNH